MAGELPRPPGWYPDPHLVSGGNRPLRYWDGRRWTDRQRPTPTVAALDFGSVAGPRPLQALEPPARAPALPAPAAEASATRHDPPGLADSPKPPAGAGRPQVELPTSPGAGQEQPPEPPRSGGGGGGSGDDLQPEAPPATAKLRGRWWFVAGVAVVAAVAVLAAAQALRPPQYGPRVLTDGHFVQLANAECDRTIPTLRPPVGGPLGSSTSPKQAADQIDRAANGLDDLAAKLAALPAAGADRPQLSAWLDGWRAYDAVGRQYAGYLRTRGTPQHQPPFLDSAAQLARGVDNFAHANGLKGCVFTFTFVSDPSQF